MENHFGALTTIIECDNVYIEKLGCHFFMRSEYLGVKFAIYRIDEIRFWSNSG